MNAIGIGRPIFVSVDEALAYHEMSVAQFGGSSGVRDLGLLDSAISQARAGIGGQLVHEYPFEMASAYAFHIAKNHPFVDGNKRTALMCCGAFLRKNGWNLESSGVEAADAIHALVDGVMDKVSFSEWLESKSVARPTLELRDFLIAVDPHRFVERYRSMQPDSDGQRPAEFQATMDEIVAAIPVVHALLDINRNAVETRNEPARISSAAAILVLSVLFRLAEDMGYEW